MNTRSKPARKARVHAARSRVGRRRRAQQTRANLSVIPVAVQASNGGAEAAIPVSVKADSNSAEAVIPVEVATTGKSPRKRAAVIPIRVQRRSGQTRRGKARSHSANTRHGQSETGSVEMRTFEPPTTQYPVPWRTVLSRVANDVTDTGQDVLHLGLEYGRTAAALLQFLFWPFLGRPETTRQVSERGTVSSRNTKPTGVATARGARAA